MTRRSGRHCTAPTACVPRALRNRDWKAEAAKANADKAAAAKAAADKAAVAKAAAAKAAADKAAAAKVAADKVAADKAAADKAAADKAAADKVATDKAAADKAAADKVAAEELRRRATALDLLQVLTTVDIADDATLKKSIAFCDEHGVTSVSDMVECDLVDDFVRHLGLKTVPGKKLLSMLQTPTSGLAAQLSDHLASPSSSSNKPSPESVAQQAAAEKAAAQNAATEGMECSFWFVNADSLRHAATPSLPMMQTLRTQEPHRLVQKTIGFVEGISGAYKNLLVVSHRWETPTDPDPNGAQALAVQAYLKEHPEIDAVWFDFSSMPQGRNKTPSESAEFKEMLPNINLLYLTCSVLILMDRSYMNRFWTQFEAYLSMRAITSDGLTNARDPKARVTIKTADDP